MDFDDFYLIWMDLLNFVKRFLRMAWVDVDGSDLWALELMEKEFFVNW